MEKYRKTLTEGVNFHAVKTDKFKICKFIISFTAPLSDENASAANMLARIINRGCEKYPTLRDISIECDRLYAATAGAAARKVGDSISLSFSFSALENEYAFDGTDIFTGAAKLLYEMIFRPLIVNGAFKEEYVNSERKNAIEDIEALINNKMQYTVKRTFEIMCDKELFSVSGAGSEAMINSLTAKELYGKFLYFINECPCNIVYVGSEEPLKIESAVKEIFPFGARRDLTEMPEIITEVDKVKDVTEVMDIAQAKLCMGFRSGSILNDEDYPALFMFLYIFGGSPTSKLFMNVREKMSLCYYCSASEVSVKGIILVQSGIEDYNREKAQDAILNQLYDIQKGNFSDTEFENAFVSAKNSCKEASDSQGVIASWILTQAYMKSDIMPDEFFEEVSKVTRDDIINVAKKVKLDTIFFLKGKN